jgi:hypothetical protein
MVQALAQERKGEKMKTLQQYILEAVQQANATGEPSYFPVCYRTDDRPLFQSHAYPGETPIDVEKRILWQAGGRDDR